MTKKKVSSIDNVPLDFCILGNTFTDDCIISGTTTVQKSPEEESDAVKAAKKKELDALERQIKKGITLTRKSGESLRKIRDKQFYTSKGYISFDAYCRGNIKLSRTHIYRLINHVEVCEILGLNYLKVPEKVVRPFCQLKTVTKQGNDRVDHFDAVIFKSIWNKACSKEEGAQGGKKQKTKLPSSTKIEELVKIQIAKAAGKTDDSMVYVVSMKKCFTRDTLVDGIITAVNSASKMLSVMNELKSVLKAEEVERLNAICCELIKNPAPQKEKEVTKAS